MMLMRRTSNLAADERAELEAYRAVFATLTEVCTRAAAGDLEARVPLLDACPGGEVVRNSLNRLLDLTDAFVREAGASLQAASEGRFHRMFLQTGMAGSFRDGAQTVNEARSAMQSAAERLDHAKQARLQLADEFESAVLGASQQVASASTELGATAGVLTDFAQAAVDQADSAGVTIATLSSSSRQIQQVVTLINQVAAQTRLLALNATIEAASAGAAGKGFAVVATEVKKLADKTAEATSSIEQEVRAVQAAAAQSGEVLERIAVTIREMHQQVLAIATAVDGSGQGRNVEFDGLSQLAELLRTEVIGFLAALRG